MSVGEAKHVEVRVIIELNGPFSTAIVSLLEAIKLHIFWGTSIITIVAIEKLPFGSMWWLISHFKTYIVHMFDHLAELFLTKEQPPFDLT